MTAVLHAAVDGRAADATRARQLTAAIEHLSDRGTPTPALDATTLLAWLLRMPASDLLAERDEPLGEHQVAAYAASIERRSRGEPVAYITGHKRFMGLDLLVDPRVFLPRPLSEALVEISLEIARSTRREILAADIGTGSGALGVALAVLEPAIRRVYAIDCSSDAVTVARLNAQRYRVDDRVRVLTGDLLSPLPEPVNLVIANLPYVSTDLTRERGPNPEPGLAFDGGRAGLDVVVRFAAAVRSHLRPGGRVVMEIGPGQRSRVVDGLGAGVRVAAPIARPWGAQVLVAQFVSDDDRNEPAGKWEG